MGILLSIPLSIFGTSVAVDSLLLAYVFARLNFWNSLSPNFDGDMEARG
jgi:hypothetical protein